MFFNIVIFPLKFKSNLLINFQKECSVIVRKAWEKDFISTCTNYFLKRSIINILFTQNIKYANFHTQIHQLISKKNIILSIHSKRVPLEFSSTIFWKRVPKETHQYSICLTKITNTQSPTYPNENPPKMSPRRIPLAISTDTFNPLLPRETT